MLKYKGFSLIEVLVSLAILSISILGFIAAEALSVNNTTIARYHSLAASISTSMAAAMRANPAYWETYSPAQLAPASLTVTASAAQSSFSSTVLSDSTLNSATTDCYVATCSATVLAAYDVKTFGMTLANLLPKGTASIKCGYQSNLSPVSCVITVFWGEKDIAIYKNISVTKNSITTKSYSMVVQP
jgi:type IV pilus assembly protein PilV